ncbi:MAG: hypothetical protein JXA09_07560 [Anaerolineae bacterium]|nr:hypothetical protein [Anaerolineae bacterium]
MRRRFSVAALYPVALMEGEGMGTAYEYSAKLKLLRRLLAGEPSPARVMVGGLPEAYGYSLDLALLAHLYDCHVTVADDREEMLAAYERALASAQLSRWVDRARVDLRALRSLAEVTTAQEPVFDLWVTTSAIQRLDPPAMGAYLAQVRRASRRALLFAPNGDNRAHLTRTKLRGFALGDLVAACRAAGLEVADSGYVDLPPFPPGVTRTEQAKARAAESRVERVAMGVLEAWSVGERFLPRAVRRRYAHLVYAYTH